MAVPAAPCLGSGRVAQINPFRIAVPDADLADLKDRLTPHPMAGGRVRR